ncbi:hypothetical protein [Cohnella fermenti]|uniref:Uncharacterized protein n=1 Tax=Cohnella fermenti TaxID=2565925 RepID=A0A4S4C4I9_9BACL|nr:hypothetical protein [Cohnella fermenti]THF82695.1 hypothetical protein E6C55_06405 [Cohnella fermenti]
MFDDYMPADEEHLLQLRGLPVCVVMSDGTRHFGTLTGCSKDKVTLNGQLFDDSGEDAEPRARPKSRRNSRSGKRVRGASRPQTKTAEAYSEPDVPEAPLWAFDEPIVRTKVILPLEPIQAVLLL